MLRVHFLNVGHGDCTVVKHSSGRITVVDINNCQDYDPESRQALFEEELAKETPGLLGILAAQARVEAIERQELTDPIEFLQRTYPGEIPFRFVLTHPDLDHMRGLKRLHENIGFLNFWDTANTKPTPQYRSDSDKEDWEFYLALRGGKIAGKPIRNYTRGDSMFAFGRDQSGLLGGDNIEILSPTFALISACNAAEKSNDLSIVLRIVHAGIKILLPGDAEANAWGSMADHYGKGLKSDILKASHHGRDSGYDLRAVQLISPARTMISVGRKPDTDASSKYRNSSQRVSSTRYHGNIEIRVSDTGKVEYFVDRNWD